MKPKSIRAIRQSELSNAAFEAVVKFGLRGTTLERVGEIAGVSKGVVLHHFKDKSLLLAAVFRRSNGLLGESVVELYRHADTPCERLWAIIVANFHEVIFNRRVCQAWVSLMAEVPHNEQCQRVQIACNMRIRSNLLRELKHFLSPDDAEKAARLLGLLIDGLWVRAGSGVEELDGVNAISEMHSTLKGLLPKGPRSITEHEKARKKMEAVAKIALGSSAFQEKSIFA